MPWMFGGKNLVYLVLNKTKYNVHCSRCTRINKFSAVGVMNLKEKDMFAHSNSARSHLSRLMLLSRHFTSV